MQYYVADAGRSVAAAMKFSLLVQRYGRRPRPLKQLYLDLILFRSDSLAQCQRLHCWGKKTPNSHQPEIQSYGPDVMTVTNVFGNKRYVPHPLCWLPRSWYPFAQVALRYFPCRPDKPRFFEDGVRSRLPAQTNPLTDWDKEDSGIFQWHSPCFWSCC